MSHTSLSMAFEEGKLTGWRLLLRIVAGLEFRQERITLGQSWKGNEKSSRRPKVEGRSRFSLLQSVVAGELVSWW